MRLAYRNWRGRWIPTDDGWIALFFVALALAMWGAWEVADRYGTAADVEPAARGGCPPGYVSAPVSGVVVGGSGGFVIGSTCVLEVRDAGQ